MSILTKIVESTNIRVQQLKSKYNTGFFKESELFNSPPVSLIDYLNRTDKNGIIAEFKRCSPSKGILNEYSKVEDVTLDYMRSGCSALSVLTEPDFFKGSSSDLIKARKFNFCPILRKDFIVDPIQILESRAIGADVILLIERILTKSQLQEFKLMAEELRMEVLIELDANSDLNKISANHALFGINSRNLADMSVSLESIVELKNNFGLKGTIIAESGIVNEKDIIHLRENGFSGFLIGSRFMQHADPGLACKEFCKELKLNVDSLEYAI